MPFELRDYQSEALNLTYQRIQEGHTPIVCAPTGSGKTILAAEMARQAVENGRRAMFISFRKEILRQTYDVFCEHIGPSRVGMLAAGEKPWFFYPDVTIASADTLKARWNRADTWRVPADLVLVDECHLSLSRKMLETVMPWYRERSTVVGFTATPARKSGKGMGSFFSRIIQVRTVQQLIDDGYLAPCEYWAGSHADLRNVKTRYGEYDEKTLAKEANNKQLVGDIIDNWARICPDRHTIVFAVDIAHAVALTERFQAAGVQAECVHSKMDTQTRSLLTEQFKSRKFQVLVNCQIATYGYDVPSVNCIVLARPTKSIVLHLQMLGRGMRPKPNGDWCTVLDHADNVRRLGCAEDLIRWRLDDGKEAAHNQTKADRDVRGDSLTTCGECGHQFTSSRTCPQCGWEKPARSKDVEVVDADLVKIRKAKGTEATKLEKRQWYAEALGWCEMNGKKPGFAYHSYKKKFGVGPVGKPAPEPPGIRVANFMKSRQVAFWQSRKVANG